MNSSPNDKPICGVVMPISAIDGCSETHWADVYEIISDAIHDAKFEPNLVSNADDVGIIHKRIIQNLYENPIVVCDVSAKNSNVMFELGLRLAFDKPTIIIKDDRTSYSFDTSAIEHLEYPRDLRFSRIVEFKEKLALKIRATHDKAANDPNYTTFLKHFGPFTVAKIETKEVSGQEFIIDELKNLRFAMRRLERSTLIKTRNAADETRESALQSSETEICLLGYSAEQVKRGFGFALEHPDLMNVGLYQRGGDHDHLTADLAPNASMTSKEFSILIRSKLGARRGGERLLTKD